MSELDQSKDPAEPPRAALIRAATVIMILALALRTFLVEVHLVPTESMEPTIVGRNPGGDRLIVAKPFLASATPERFDLVVFRYPLARDVRFVKRLIGLPGERLTIQGGDIWVQPEGAPRAEIARKPRALQERIFDDHPIIPAADRRDFDASRFSRHWDAGTGADLRIEGGVIYLAARGALQRLALVDRLNPVRRDAYATSRTERRNDEALAARAIGDLRVSAEVVADRFELELRDGRDPARPVRLSIDGRIYTLKLADRVLATGPLQASEGSTRRLTLQRADGFVSAFQDGELLAESAVNVPPDAVAPSQVFVVLPEGASAEIHALGVDRDLHWLAAPSGPQRDLAQSFEIPAGHYFVLGDNSPHSEDSRQWRAIGIRRREDGVVLIGDLRGVHEDEFETPAPSLLPSTNPSLLNGPVLPGADWSARTQEPHLFRDLHGNRYLLAPESWDLLDLKAFAGAGDPRVLAWHGRAFEPTANDPRIAIPAVPTSTLAGLSHGGRMIDQFALPMPLLPAADLIGRPLFAVRALSEDGGVLRWPKWVLLR